MISRGIQSSFLAARKPWSDLLHAVQVRGRLASAGQGPAASMTSLSE
jgi:hypothetical protein